MAIRQFYAVVPSGEDVDYVVECFFSPITIALTPGNGGTMTLSYKVTEEAATFVESDYADVSARTEIVIDYPLSVLRFSAATQDGLVELASA